MAAVAPVANLERLRLQLEENVAKLQAALKHWQTWEAEYEGLKEEIEQLPQHVGEADLIRVGDQFDGDIVKDKEISELFKLDEETTRSAKQIVGLLDRRIDYVQKNVQTLLKQLEATRTKLEHASVVSEPEARTKDGLPVTDIYEELDEDGNVISSSVSRPGYAEPQLLQALQKAGLKKQDLEGDCAGRLDSAETPTDEANGHRFKVGKPREAPTVESIGTKEAAPPPDPSKSAPAKVVASAPAQPQSPLIQPENHSRKLEAPSSFIQDVAKHSFPNGDRVIEVDSDDEEVSAIGAKPAKPESAADAALRARMLEYSLREVGDIVAQIDLDEAGAEVTDSGTEEFGSDEDLDIDGDSDLDLEDDYDASSAEDEDEHGLSRSGNLSEEYRKEMRELENRLNARMFQNVGPSPNDAVVSSTTTTDDPSAPNTISSATSPKPIKSALKTTSKAKGVRFAQNLDVAPTTAASESTQAPAESAPAPSGPAFKDTIIERRPAPSPSTPETAQAKKVSRFKASRQSPVAQVEIQPHRSATQPLADTIIERPSVSSKSNGPTTPIEMDEFAPAVQRQQLASQYYRQRNQQVQKQGGYARMAREEEEKEGEVSDDELEYEGQDGDDAIEGGRKKVSLFKKARISGWDGGRSS